MAEQYVSKTVTYTDEQGDVQTMEMQEVQYTVRGSGHVGERWYNCLICGFSFPASKVVLDGGQAYCTVHKHNECIGTRRHE